VNTNAYGTKRAATFLYFHVNEIKTSNLLASVFFFKKKWIDYESFHTNLWDIWLDIFRDI